MWIGLTIGCFGSKVTHLRMTRDIDQPINGMRPFLTMTANSPILPRLSLASSNILERDSGPNSSYNALWLTVDRAGSQRALRFDASYTCPSRSTTTRRNRQGVTIPNSCNIQGDRGLSDYDAAIASSSPAFTGSRSPAISPR